LNGPPTGLLRRRSLLLAQHASWRAAW